MCVPHIWLIALLVTETNKSKSNNVTAVSVLCCMSACALRKIVCAAVCVCVCVDVDVDWRPVVIKWHRHIGPRSRTGFVYLAM